MERIASGSLFARYRLGAVTITALSDGYVDLPPDSLRQPGDQAFGDDLPAEVALEGAKLRLSVNCFLIEDGGARVLIDTGSSNAWEPSMGRLPQALDAAGVDPASIGAVVFTHTHTDHVHGLILPDGGDGFPSMTRLLAPEAERDMFRGKDRLARFHDRVEGFAPGARITDAIEAVDAIGHEIGHSGFRVSSAGETLLIWGDAVHVPSIQFARPEIGWAFDADQDAARASRLRLMAEAADRGACVAGAHLDFPGVGRVARDGAAYEFTPL